MNSTIDSLHCKLTSKFDYLIELSNYLRNVYIKFQEFESVDIPKRSYKSKNKILEIPILSSNLEITSELENLYKRYSDITLPMISEYYDLIDLGDKLKLKQKFEDYQKVITTENFINLMDHYMSVMKKFVEKLYSTNGFKKFLQINSLNIKEFITVKNTSFLLGNNLSNSISNELLLQLSFKDTVEKFIELFDENKIVFQAKIKPINECECGGKMIINTTTSIKSCLDCGNLIYMSGTVFDDSQFYNQQGICTKHKKYDSDKHCKKWLEQIQATEDVPNIAFNKVIERLDKRAIKEYTRNGILRSMNGMKCKQIREWLKDYKLTTKWNDHAPLIRKTITALHGDAVIPPQLTKEENDNILADFSCDMNLYEELSKKEEILQLIDKDKIQNKPYYPFGLLKVLCQRLKGDIRLPKLIECIHFQSSQTSVKNDKIHRIICIKRGKLYEPTDRTVLIEIQ